MKNLNIIDERKLNSAERKAAIPLLYDPNIFEKVLNCISDFVVGERESVATIFLCSCGKLVTNNQTASYNLLVNDESGAGKDHVTDATLKVWDTKTLFKRTRISPAVFTYWKQQTQKEKDAGLPPFCWDGRILYLEDISDNIFNSEIFKVMSSSGSHTTVVKDQRAVDIKIHGKPILVCTSASASPKSELIRRFAVVNLDTSIDQTKAILQRQAEAAAHGKRYEYDPIIKSSLTYLNRCQVKIPFADKLLNIIPDGIIMRTHFPRMLDLIKASCALHQYQREQDAEGYLIANPQDYDIARIVLQKITSNPKMISLTKNQQKLLLIFDKLERLAYSVSDLKGQITFMGERQLYRELEKLADLGFLNLVPESRSDSKKPVICYKYVPMLKVNLPDWEKLQKAVKSDKLDKLSIKASLSNDNEIEGAIDIIDIK